MLPKIWKKFLLAICIIACIYNIMSKLVNRNSLEINLKSVDDGTTVFNLFPKEEVLEGEDNLVESQVLNSTENNENAEAKEAVPTDENTEETANVENSGTNEETSADNVENDEKKNKKDTKFIVLY